MGRAGGGNEPHVMPGVTVPGYFRMELNEEQQAQLLLKYSIC